MKTLTESQLSRLEDATGQLAKLIEQRPLSIPDEDTLVAVINALDWTRRLLEAGEHVYIRIVDQNGLTVAAAPFVLENS